MSIAQTPAVIKRGVLIVALAAMAFVAGFAVQGADAEPSSGFIACVNNHTGVMRMSEHKPVYVAGVAAAAEGVEVCRPHETAWEMIAFPVIEESTRPLGR